MILSDAQIEYIATNLEFYGVLEGSLKEDLLDHICTFIENSGHQEFDTAYAEAIQKFGGHYALGVLQQQTVISVLLQKNRSRMKVIYTSGFFAIMLISTGAIFKMMYWPYASMLMVAGFAVLNLIFMPVFFYHRYKVSGQQHIIY